MNESMVQTSVTINKYSSEKVHPSNYLLTNNHYPSTYFLVFIECLWNKKLNILGHTEPHFVFWLKIIFRNMASNK